MTELNAAQLSFEAIARELKHSDLAADLRKIVIAELKAPEKYLNDHAVHKWQKAGGGIWIGAKSTKIEALDLKAFIGGRGDGHFDFEKEVSTRLDHIARVLQGKLFGHPTPDETETWWKDRLKRLAKEEANFRINSAAVAALIDQIGRARELLRLAAQHGCPVASTYAAALLDRDSPDRTEALHNLGHRPDDTDALKFLGIVMRRWPVCFGTSSSRSSWRPRQPRWCSA